MSYDKLKKHKPLVHKVDVDPIPDSGFRRVTTKLPAKLVKNTKGNMDLLDLYTKGPLKWENTGDTCFNCVNFYFDKNSRLGGRCRALGFKETHESTPAKDTKNWVHPVIGVNFPLWPGCREYISKSRLSRR